MTDREKRSFRALARRDREEDELRTDENSTQIKKELDQGENLSNGDDTSNLGSLAVSPTSTETTTPGKKTRGRGIRRSKIKRHSTRAPVATPGQLDDPNNSGVGLKKYRLGNSGSRYRSAAYTHDELQSVVDYVCEHKKHPHTGSIRTWKEAKEKGFFETRTAEAIQQQFRKTIFPHLDAYKCTEEDKRLLRLAKETSGRQRLGRVARSDTTAGDEEDDDDDAAE